MKQYKVKVSIVCKGGCWGLSRKSSAIYRIVRQSSSFYVAIVRTNPADWLSLSDPMNASQSRLFSFEHAMAQPIECEDRF